MKSVGMVCIFVSLVIATALAQSNPVPFISQPLVPTSVAAGGPEFTLTVNGAGFVATSAVNWNGSTLPTTVVSGTKLTAKVPAANVGRAGTAVITVTNANASASNAVFFSAGRPGHGVQFNPTPVEGDFSGLYTLAGDFNNDGIQDLARGVGDSGGIWVSPGNGDGTFGDTIYSSCGSPYYERNFAAADFNGDGKVDLISDQQAQAQVCLGNGDGSFTALPSFQIAEYPGPFATGDFNGDGRLDIASVERNSYVEGFLEILLGNGDATFVRGQVIYANTLQSAAVGDFNRDGKLDLALSTYDSVVLIFLGNGDGSFQPALSYGTGTGAGGVVVADLNGDGKLDLAVSNFYSNSVSILMGNGDGTFQPKIDYPTGTGPSQILVADFDRDGKLDLAVADDDQCSQNCVFGYVSLLLGNGDGTFGNHVEFPTGVNPVGLTVADFNNDGRLDLATAGNSLTVLLQGSKGPNAILTPTSLTFANQNVGTKSSAQAVTLTNTGTGQLVISSFDFAGANPGDYTQTNDCGTGVARGRSCTIQVVFAPTATGLRASTLEVNDNAHGSPQRVSLTGNGVAPAVTFSPASLTFLTTVVGAASLPQSVTLTNTGSGQLVIHRITTQGDFRQENTCGSGLAPGQSCTVSVQFKPKQIDTRTGAVRIVDNAPDSPQSVSLTGTGTIVKLSGIGINFGNQKVGTSSPTSAIKMTNVGSVTLNISGVTITGANPGDFSQTNNCGSSLPAHATCELRVQFTPTMTGPRSATLSISDDGGGSPQSVTLSGNGT